MKDELRELGLPSKLSMCFEVLPIEVSPFHADGQENCLKDFGVSFYAFRSTWKRGVVFR